MLTNLSHLVPKQTSRTTIINETLKSCFLRSFSSWSFAIKNASSPRKALILYNRMQRQRIPFDSFAILFTLKSCTQMNNLPIVRHLHAHLLKLGFGCHVYVATALMSVYMDTSFADAVQVFGEMPDKNSVTWNALIDGYLRRGDINMGLKLFEEMPERDLESWSAMIAGYMSNGFCVEGLAFFREMMSVEGLKPDQAALVVVLSGFPRMGRIGLVLGKILHGFAIKNYWGLNVELGTCLVDTYAKCGCLKYSCLVFDMMQEKDVVTWTALICGAAQHGYGKEGVLAFERMTESGIKPNELAFTGVLTSCAKSGMVEEGRNYFKMIEVYGLRPRIQHYGCMVDLFGKAGLLGEAYEVIKTMPYEPNIVIWGSFLVSCKLHKQFEMAERVIEWIMSVVKPNNDGGVYTLIADLYALNDRWHDAERIRKVTASQHVKKSRGYS